MAGNDASSAAGGAAAPAPGEAGAMRARLLALLFAMNVVNFIDRVNVTILAPVILRDLGWDKARLGTVMSATLLGYAAGQIPAGVLVDRYGAFWLVAALCLAWSIATALTPLAFASFAVVLAVRFLLGLFEAVNNPGQTAINVRAFPPGELARAQGICFAGTQVGPLVGSPIITAVAAAYSWEAVFYGCAVLGFAWVAAWVAAAPAIARPGAGAARAAARGDDAPWPQHRSAPAAAATGAAGRLWPLRTRPVQALAAAGLLWGYAMWLFVSWFPTYLSDAWGLTLAELGWVNTIPTLGGITAILLGGVLSDRLVRRGLPEGRSRQLLAGCGLAGSAVCIAGAVFASSAWLAVAGFTLNGLVQGLAVAPFYSLPAVLAPRAAGTIAAVMNFCAAIGGVLSPTLAGILRDQTGGWQVPFLTASAAVLASGIVVLAAVRAEPLVEPDGPGRAVA